MNKNPILQRILITILRVAIGWHFIYEAIVKLNAENWTSAGYLSNSTGFLSGAYQWMAGNPAVLKVIDLSNMYGLLFIGVGLFLGILIRYAAYAGILLLLLYYFAYPPFGFSSLYSPEGNLFIVHKILIEALALSFIAIYKEKGYSIDSLFNILIKSKNTNDAAIPVYQSSRREALKNLASLPVLGIMGWGAVRNYKENNVDVFSGATLQAENSSLNELKGELPKGRIGNHEISRLVLGGNLIGGWSHSRDLIYVSSLFKAYNTEKKIYETLVLAEKAGINTINIGFSSNPVLARYKKTFGSKIKVISQVAPNMKTGDIYEQINKAIDNGADILQIQGNWCDWLVRDKNPEVISKMMDRIKGQGYTAGLGAHTIQSFITCRENGLIPDYYMATMHHDQYWSAHPRQNRIPFEVDGRRNPEHEKFHDNMFCLFPDHVIDFLEHTDIPVMGFKILAAGAINPEDGFKWALKNGADFICVGMFDFQIVKDVNICIDTINGLVDRKRKWFA